MLKDEDANPPTSSTDRADLQDNSNESADLNGAPRQNFAPSIASSRHTPVDSSLRFMNTDDLYANDGVAGHKDEDLAEQPSAAGEMKCEANATSRPSYQPIFRDEDYSRRYPNDDYGMEMGPDARVWKTYLDEAEIADKDYITDTTATLDGILIFASIFSAIVTTFVNQTYQALQQDPQTQLLVELITVQRVSANSSSVNDIPSTNTLPSRFSPSSSDIWINSLWFISLILSLLTAFLGVLARQWLHQYIAVTSGSPRTRALIRQARNMGLQEWYVPTLIGFLPIILHVSLALFFAGLVILLQTMLSDIAYVAAGVVGVVYVAYFIANLLPIFYPRCPYRTTLTPGLYRFYASTSSFLLHLAPSDEWSCAPTLWKRRRWVAWLGRLRVSISPSTKQTNWKAAEAIASTQTHGLLEGKAVSFLYTASYSPTAKHVALEAFASFLPTYHRYRDSWGIDMGSVEAELRRGCEHLCKAGTSIEAERQLEVLLRALIQIQPPSFPPQHYRESYFPRGVEEFVPVNKSSSQLDRLRKSGWFRDPASDDTIEDILISIMKPGSGPQLPTGTWVALLSAAPRNFGHRKYTQSRLQSITGILNILWEVEFFSSAPIPEEIPPTTIHQPNHAMCLAMVEFVRPGDELPFLTLPSDSVHRGLLELLYSLGLWACVPSDVDDKLAALDALLDCLLQLASRKSNWSHLAKRNANILLYLFVQGGCFHFCVDILSESLMSRTVIGKVLALVEQLFLPDHPYADILLFHKYPHVPIARLALGNYLEQLDSASHGRSGQQWTSATGFRLFCQAMDKRDHSAYKNVIAMDVLPALYDASSKGYIAFATDSAAMFVEHYLGGIPTAHERTSHLTKIPTYTSEQITYLQEPDNLYRLCCILLQDGNWEYTHRIIVRLLSICPRHPSWTVCLNKLRNWTPHAVDRLAHSVQHQRRLKQAHCDVFDMQQILAIEDDRLDFNLEWNGRHDNYTSHGLSFDVQRLKAYYEANSSKISVSTDQHLHWKDRARKALRLGYSKSTGDMEMAEPMGSA